VGLRNIFLMSIFGLASGTAADTVGDDDVEDIEALPVAFVASGTVPKEFTPSDSRAGAAAGDKNVGVGTSSIEPKVTAEPWKKSALALHNGG
jgi:hypothetical protein